MEMLAKKPFPWIKQGLIYDNTAGEYTYASLPFTYHLQGDEFLLIFTRRDRFLHSNTFTARINVEKGRIGFLEEPRLALAPGRMGTFDCDGAAGMYMMESDGQVYLYYGSWQNLPIKGMWIAEVGRARLNVVDYTFERDFEGPVFGRCIDEPLWGTGPSVLKENDTWHMWYCSLDKWEMQADGTIKHYYNIKHRYSKDGIHWESGRTVSIDFANELEYAIARPYVIHEAGKPFQMWYSFRAQPGVPTYRIGYAESEDGIIWTRRDKLAGIDVSPSGWDSEMVCYASVFRHKDYLYMLYNGNAYGKTGFGLASFKDK